MFSLIFLVCTVFFFSRELPNVQEMSGALGMYGYPPRATFEESLKVLTVIIRMHPGLRSTQRTILKLQMSFR